MRVRDSLMANGHRCTRKEEDNSNLHEYSERSKFQLANELTRGARFTKDKATQNLDALYVPMLLL